MQVKELKNEGLSRELEITIDAADMDKQVDTKLQEYGKTMRMPGFRPGKVPLKVLKKRYGRAVLGEVMEQAVNDTSQKVMNERGIRPAAQPKIEVKDFDEGKDLTYTMAVESLPEFEVMDTGKIEIEKPVAQVGEEVVQDSLERVASQNKQSVKIEEDRPARQGDVLRIDFAGRKKEDGESFPGMSSENFDLELGSGSFIPGFEDQLIGTKAGDKLEVEVTFPEEYGMPGLAGKEAIFDVSVHEIREYTTGEINDEMAQNFGLEDLDALKKAIEEQLEKEFSQMSRMKAKRALLDALDEGHDFPLPGGMVDGEYQNILHQVQHEKHGHAHAHDHDHDHEHDEDLSEEEKDELYAIAERRVRLGLVLSEIGRQNNIQVGDQELHRAVIEEAQKYPGQEKDVFDYFNNNPQALEQLRAPLFEDKVVDYLLELVNVTEKDVTPDELARDDDEEQEQQQKQKTEKSDTKSKSKTSSKSGTKSAGKSTAKSESKSKSSAKKAENADDKKKAEAKSGSKSGGTKAKSESKAKTASGSGEGKSQSKAKAKKA